MEGPPQIEQPAPDRRRLLPWGLSGKLLILTVCFVMLAEVLIYIPSIAAFRNTWLQDKLDSAALLAMAVATAPATALPPDLEQGMLRSIGVEAIAERSSGQRWLIAQGDMPVAIAAHHDLTSLKPFDSVRAAFATLLSRGDGMILVSGRPPAGSDRFEIVIRQSELRSAMLAYSRGIVLFSLIISAITAALIYAALRLSIIGPVQRLSANLLAFSAAPENAANVIAPSGRRDEIGAAQEQLAAMQRSLQETLAQRRHLADLGLAVSKINHDLRNILASAQLFSDRLAAVDDPLVKRFAPKLMGAVDRAVGYATAVLAYGKASEEPPRRQLVALARLADDVADVLALPTHERVRWENRVPAELEVDADPEQLFRVLMNLCRNALDALTETDDPAIIRRIWIEGGRQGSVAAVRICDTGPGVPARARENLFQPFQGSARRGGTGLGLAIAAELVHAHGGDIRLVDRSGAGAVFEITLPDRPVDFEAHRQVRTR